MIIQPLLGLDKRVELAEADLHNRRLTNHSWQVERLVLCIIDSSVLKLEFANVISIARAIAFGLTPHESVILSDRRERRISPLVSIVRFFVASLLRMTVTNWFLIQMR
jgi:hypothetical protein